MNKNYCIKTALHGKFNRLLPLECSPMGAYECQVPMPLSGRLQSIDYCIADLVAALNAANIVTKASCCGHMQKPGSIILEDDRVLTITMFDHEHGEGAVICESCVACQTDKDNIPVDCPAGRKQIIKSIYTGVCNSYMPKLVDIKHTGVMAPEAHFGHSRPLEECTGAPTTFVPQNAAKDEEFGN